MLVDAFARSPSPMVITDARAPDNPITWVNDAFLGLTGFATDELLGRNCRMLQGPGTDPAEVARPRRVIGERAAGPPRHAVATERLASAAGGTGTPSRPP